MQPARNVMKSGPRIIAVLIAALGIGAAQTPSTALEYLSTAKAAAGTCWARTFLRLCIPCAAGPQGGRGGAPGAARGAGRGTPAKEIWHAEPARVAESLYFLGTRIHSAWAIVGSQGIIV